MKPRLLLPFLLPLLMLAACTEDQPPTAPAEPGDMAEDHAVGHKVVNSLADPGNGICNATQCTLREAINDPASTEISFAPGLTGPITLSPGGSPLVINKRLSITGPGTGIVIRRRADDPHLRIFRIGSGVTVTLANLTIRNGGGIFNVGTLRLTHCTVVGSSGVGVFNRDHKLTLTNSRVTDIGEVGIVNQGGTLELTHSTVARNSSNGIITVGGTAMLSHARIIDNSGGGILASNSRVTITHSTIARNSGAPIGGGIENREGGTVAIRNSTIVGNSAVFGGGGIANQAVGIGPLSVALTLTNSTVSGNSAPFGGGIVNAGFGQASLTVRNSTIADNSATQGGGIGQSEGDAFLVTLINSLVAENSAPTGPDVLKGTGAVDARFSLIGDGTGSGITNTNGNQVGNVSPNASPIDPRLGLLADNGGPTRTHALLLGSPAIDAALTPACPITDQRGVLRPQGPACDIGSYERR